MHGRARCTATSSRPAHRDGHGSSRLVEASARDNQASGRRTHQRRPCFVAGIVPAATWPCRAAQLPRCGREATPGHRPADPARRTCVPSRLALVGQGTIDLETSPLQLHRLPVLSPTDECQTGRVGWCGRDLRVEAGDHDAPRSTCLIAVERREGRSRTGARQNGIPYRPGGPIRRPIRGPVRAVTASGSVIGRGERVMGRLNGSRVAAVLRRTGSDRRR